MSWSCFKVKQVWWNSSKDMWCCVLCNFTNPQKAFSCNSINAENWSKWKSTVDSAERCSFPSVTKYLCTVFHVSKKYVCFYCPVFSYDTTTEEIKGNKEVSQYGNINIWERDSSLTLNPLLCRIQGQETHFAGYYFYYMQLHWKIHDGSCMIGDLLAPACASRVLHVFQSQC